MKLGLITCLVTVSSVLVALPAHVSAVQDDLHFVPADRVTVRQMNDVSAIELAPGVNVRTVVGTTGSVSIGEFEPGSAAVLHHHTREQADIGITGQFDVTLDDRVEKFGPGSGMIIPSNVAHSIANNSRSRATVIEFHTVRRPDLVPPRPTITFPMSEKPAPLAAGRQLVQPLDRPVRESPTSAFWLRGNTCLMAWRPMSSGSQAVELRAGAVERFEYVMRGEIQMTSGTSRNLIKAGSVIVVPAHGTITVQAAGPSNTVLAEFIPAPSER